MKTSLGGISLHPRLVLGCTKNKFALCTDKLISVSAAVHAALVTKAARAA